MVFPESPAPGGNPAIVLDINRPDGSMQFTRTLLGLGQKAVLRGRVRQVVFQDIEGLDIDAFSRERIDASVTELQEERAAVEKLGLL